MYPNPFPFTLYNVTAETPTPPSPTFNYCYGGDWVQGYVGNYGMSFDGTNEYVAVNTLATSMQGKNTFSVAFWASGSAYGADPAAFVLSDGGVSSETFALYPYDNSGGDGFRVFYNGTSIINENDATRTGWNYFAYVQNGATDHKIYVNGQQEGTSITSKTLDAQLDLSGIGGEGTLAEYFSGELDEVAVWNVALPASKISELYNSGTGLRADTIAPSPATTGSFSAGYLGNYGLENDGTDGYITTPTATDIEFGNDSTFSIACWVSSSQGSLQGFVSKATQSGLDNNGWIIGRTMGSFFGSDNEFFASVRSGGNYGFIFSDAAIDDGWHHMVFTRDGATPGNTIMYIDGVAQTDTTMGGGAGASPSNLTDSGTAMMVARYWDQATGYNLDGQIDEVAVWDVVLDSGAVSNLYNNGTGSIASNVSSSNLVSYYDFEDGPGNSTIQDRTGNGHTGTLTGTLTTGSLGDLLLYYDFEIGDSNPVSGNFPTSTTVYDTVTSSYHGATAHTGTMTNMEVADFGSWEQGRIGKYSLKFIYNTSADTGGTSLNSTYVDIGGTVTDFARTDAYSISGWLKPNYSGGEADRCDVFANNVGGQFPQGWYVLAFQKKVYFFFGTSGTAYITRQTNSAVLDTTDWIHFTITYNGNSLNTGIKIYINGSEAASTGGSAGTFNGTVNYSSARLRIGGMANGYSIFHRFPGNMDELAVWDVELDSGAASALYNGALANSVSSSNLVAYYDMETDGPGNLTLEDLSTNAISGSMINMSSGSCGAG